MRHKHCFTWNIARNTQKRGKLEMNTVGPGVWRKKMKIMENEKHTVLPGIWQETLKDVENEKSTQ